MKKIIFSLVFALLLVFTGCSKEETPVETGVVVMENNTNVLGYTYHNKITGGAADPFILEHNGAFYLYSTGGSQFTVRKSTDLVNWEKLGTILALSDTTWAVKSGWAPEMYEYNGKFYLIFSAQGKNDIHSIDIAVCDTPYGTFTPLYDQPFFSPDYSVIDASLFFDDDGRIYMYYSKDCSTNYVDGMRTSQTWGVELKPDFSGTIGEHVLISTPEQPWELKSGSVRWNEGPVVFKENGIYYLLFSANYYQSEHYSVGYATSDSPLKMFKKSENACILSGNGTTVTGPGHCNILRSPDGTEMYVVYHVHTVPPNTDNGRSLAIDRLLFKEDGSLEIDGPSEIHRPTPSGVGGFYHLTSGFTYSASGDKWQFSTGSNIDNLFDGIAQRTVNGIFSMEDGGSVEIKFDEPQKLHAVLVHTTLEDYYVPGRVDIEVNGKYAMNDCGMMLYGGKLAVANLSELPEETLVENFKITVGTGEGKEYAALSEITMIVRK